MNAASLPAGVAHHRFHHAVEVEAAGLLARRELLEKVIIPAYTCYSVPSAIRKAGLEVVPCDIREETLDFDPEQLASLCDGNTLCVVPTHLFGIPSDVKTVRRIAEKYGTYIVEDAAQAMGVRHGGERLGTAGDVAFFSFGRGKNITCGSGGLIVTSSREIAERIRILHGRQPFEHIMENMKTFVELFVTKMFLSPYLYWFPDGLPILKLGETVYPPDFPVYRMGGFKAGFLRNWRTRLEKQNETRSAITTRYIQALGLNRDIGIYSNSVPCLRFLLTCDGERLFLISFAADNPPKPPPRINT